MNFVLLAVVGIGVHAFNHVQISIEDLWRLLADPAHATINPGTFYHPISAVLYGWLAVVVYRGRNWGRIAITVLLASQFVGRYFVFMAYPTIEARAELVTGWVLSLAVLFLLWWPKPARVHFG